MVRKGLDPNASFRRQVETSPEQLKVLVEADKLERLLNAWEFEHGTTNWSEEFRESITAARKAQGGHRG